MPAVEPDMDITETPENLDPVGFIDTWLEDNALWLNARTMDFALDLRSLVTEAPDGEPDILEPVGADA